MANTGYTYIWWGIQESELKQFTGMDRIDRIRGFIFTAEDAE
jgi:hypothetical protein